MKYTYKKCPICGSENLKEVRVDKLSQAGDDLFSVYTCLCCGENVSTKTSYLEKQNRLNNAAKRISEANLKTLSAVEVFKMGSPFVVEIVTSFGENVKLGSGMLIGNGYILTNAHVVLPDISEGKGVVNLSDEIQCKTDTEEYLQIEVICANREIDIAILYGENVSKNGVHFSEVPVTTGEKVFAIGNSKGRGLCILDGIVSDSKRAVNERNYLMYSVPTVNGNSGGPLFNDKGEVVGMVTMGQKDIISMNYALPVSALKQYIKSAEQDEGISVFSKE